MTLEEMKLAVCEKKNKNERVGYLHGVFPKTGMTQQELQLAVCEKLPHKLTSSPCGYYWTNSIGQRLVRWPTEGLQVCHEAEKVMQAEGNHLLYTGELQEVMNKTEEPLSIEVEWCHTHATYEQRLEALCRVWYPERFNKHNP